MVTFRKKDKEALIVLTSDVINYGLSDNEGLEYIAERFGRPISRSGLYNLKKIVNSGKHANAWLNHYTKVGFLIKHKQIIDNVEKIQQDSLKDYIRLMNIPEEERDEDSRVWNKIRGLRYDIRENAKLLQELSLGTPIIAQIKAKIEHAEMLQSSQ